MTAPFVLYFSTKGAYLCHINLKKEVNMWLAVLVFVCLSVEVLSYLTGGDTNNGIKGSGRNERSPETA